MVQKTSGQGDSQHLPGSSISSGTMKESSLTKGEGYYRVSYHDALQYLQLLSSCCWQVREV